MKDLPVAKLQDRTSIGLEIRHTSDPAFREVIGQLVAHRDDNYLFILVEHGDGSLLLDFAAVTLSAHTLCCIRPGQVHHRMRGNTDSRAWVLAVDPGLVPAEYRTVFEDPLAPAPPYSLDDETFPACQVLVELLAAQGTAVPAPPFQLPVTRSLLEAFLGLVARAACQGEQTVAGTTRPMQLTQAFRQLLTEQVTSEKRPAAYAGLLNVTEAYLNEAVKSITGFTVTYWILHEVLLQAKRLLYYTHLTVKEIAQQLGYEDATYFSRLFKKGTQTTPLAFREVSRE